ncbi:dipeptide epimerase [Rhizobium sp. CFBP 8762]|uniref:N-acetyl-D-Glu racemase DgcA n=1 Tax=Rhizobium sp. CFBP 8762 TaxID=2775279 RepID=UPI00177DAA5A|nr:N-acetyl-D-Glu racemase DgcA [Rhizobium sp. CFBP 8762]MBD8555832.1 dipeptide epimerase [Rhizobium sp. CFBP 8762]
MLTTLTITHESFPIAGSFTISRGAKTAADVLCVRLTQGQHTGCGECVPYARYGESMENVTAAIEAVRSNIEAGADRLAVQTLMPAGAARNAVDCALWDLDAKRGAMPAWRMMGETSAPVELTTAYTISLGEPETMAAQAKAYAHRALLKVKVGTGDDVSRIRAVRAAAPDSALILDANEGWRPETLAAHFAVCVECDVRLIEQPLPQEDDGALATVSRPVPVCADESVHKTDDLASLVDRYDAINIKLDKAGGLTEALLMRARARELGLKVMVGCMVGTSLAMAPAVLLAQGADFVDLDGPLLLAKDREPGLAYRDSLVLPPEPRLWG